MTTLNEIRMEIKRITTKANTSLKRFNAAVNRDKEIHNSDAIKKSCNSLNHFKKFKGGETFKFLSNVMPDYDTDIEKHIESMPDIDQQTSDKKLDIRTALTECLDNIKRIEGAIDQGIETLDSNMKLLSPEEIQLNKATNRYNKLVSTISKINVMPPETTKNKALKDTYKKMQLAFENMKKLSSDNNSLKQHKNYTDAIDILQSSYEQYQKYEEDYKKTLLEQVSKYQDAITKQAETIGSKLTALGEQISSYSKYIPKDSDQEINTKYESLREKNNTLLKAGLTGKEYQSVRQQFSQQKSLNNELQHLKKETRLNQFNHLVTNNADLNQKLTSQILRLKEEIDPDIYSELRIQLDGIELPKSQGHSIKKQAQLYESLDKIDKTLSLIESKHKAANSSVIFIVDGFDKKEGKAFLETFLGSNKLDPINVADILNKANQKVGEDSVIKTLNQVDLSKITDEGITGISAFIKEKALGQTIALREKIECYELLKHLEDKTHLTQIEDPDFRKALLFLKNKEFEANDAISLINSGKREVLLQIQTHCSDKITATEINEIMSVDEKSNATMALINKMKPATSKETITSLVKELATRQTEFAKAIISIQDNTLLFTPIFLLCLINGDLKRGNTIRTSMVNKLSAEDGSDYIEVLTAYYKDNISYQSRRNEGEIENLNLRTFDKINKSRTEIAILAKLFIQIEQLFKPLITDAIFNLKDNLIETKTQIFNAFLESDGLENGYHAAQQIIDKNFPDDRTIFEIISDGLAIIFEYVKNLLDNQPKAEEPFTTLNPYQQGKQITRTFKEQIEDLKSEKSDISPNKINRL